MFVGRGIKHSLAYRIKSVLHQRNLMTDSALLAERNNLAVAAERLSNFIGRDPAFLNIDPAEQDSMGLKFNPSYRIDTISQQA